MRKISLSGKWRWISSFSSLAEARSRPNGFSTITRVQPSVERRSPISWRSVAIASGGTAR